MFKGRSLQKAGLVAFLALGSFTQHASLRERVLPEPPAHSQPAQAVPPESGKRPHPCVKKTIPGGLPAQSYILLQLHKSPLTGRHTPETALSQVFIYHAIKDLIRKHGISVVFTEGSPVDLDLRQTEVALVRREIEAAFSKCIITFSGSGSAEDYCLGRLLWVDNVHHMLLIYANPSVEFKGYEKDIEEVRRVISIMKQMEGVLEKGKEAFKAPETQKFAGEYLETIRRSNARREHDAIQAALSQPSRNSAVVMGSKHEEGLIRAAEEVPFEQRPTFHFIPSSCQQEPGFFVSPEVIKAAVDSTEHLGK